MNRWIPRPSIDGLTVLQSHNGDLPLAPALPAVDKTPSPQWRDVLRIYPWLIRGYLYGACGACGRCAKVYAWLILVLLTLMPPALLIGFMLFPAMLGWSRRPVLLSLVGALVGVFLLMFPVAGAAMLFGRGRRAYMSSSRDAVLVVRAAGGRWKVENFFAAHPKTSETESLWDFTVPALLEAADRAGVHIEATAMNEKLARHYKRKIPDLRRLGVVCTGQVKLLRVPRPHPTS